VIRWGQAASPIIAGGRLIVHAEQCCALDLATGAVAWSTPARLGPSSAGASGGLAPETLAAGDAPGRAESSAPGLLPRRVHLPVQPAYVPTPREAVLPSDPTGRGCSARALRVADQACPRPATEEAQAIVPTCVKGIPQ
jgi:hypothetical protein